MGYHSRQEEKPQIHRLSLSLAIESHTDKIACKMMPQQFLSAEFTQEILVVKKSPKYAHTQKGRVRDMGLITHTYAIPK